MQDIICWHLLMVNPCPISSVRLSVCLFPSIHVVCLFVCWNSHKLPYKFFIYLVDPRAAERTKILTFDRATWKKLEKTPKFDPTLKIVSWAFSLDIFHKGPAPIYETGRVVYIQFYYFSWFPRIVMYGRTLDVSNFFINHTQLLDGFSWLYLSKK